MTHEEKREYLQSLAAKVLHEAYSDVMIDKVDYENYIRMQEWAMSVAMSIIKEL